MAEQQTFGAEGVEGVGVDDRRQQQWFNDSPTVDLVATMSNIGGAVHKHGEALADHDGQLKSFATVVASIQTTLSAWIMVAGVIAAMTAMIGALEFYNGQKIDAAATKADLGQKTDRLEQRIDKVESRIDEIGKDLRALPDLISERLKKRH
jgi:hypothetical protein